MTYEKRPWNWSRVLGAHILPGLNPLVAGSWGTWEYREGLREQPPQQWRTQSVTIYQIVPKYFQISTISIAILNTISCNLDQKTNPTSPASFPV